MAIRKSRKKCFPLYGYNVNSDSWDFKYIHIFGKRKELDIESLVKFLERIIDKKTRIVNFKERDRIYNLKSIRRIRYRVVPFFFRYLNFLRRNKRFLKFFIKRVNTFRSFYCCRNLKFQYVLRIVLHITELSKKVKVDRNIMRFLFDIFVVCFYGLKRIDICRRDNLIL